MPFRPLSSALQSPDHSFSQDTITRHPDVGGRGRGAAVVFGPRFVFSHSSSIQQQHPASNSGGITHCYCSLAHCFSKTRYLCSQLPFVSVDLSRKPPPDPIHSGTNNLTPIYPQHSLWGNTTLSSLLATIAAQR